jgi:hypothetical protein
VLNGAADDVRLNTLTLRPVESANTVI